MEDMFMTKPMIIAIDDDELILNMLRRMLERAGYSVRLFSDGESALQAITSDPEAFAAIVCDWHMPGIWGHEVYQRSKPHLRDRPFILFTSEPEPFHNAHPTVATEIHVLNKNPAQLIDLLHTLLTS